VAVEAPALLAGVIERLDDFIVLVQHARRRIGIQVGVAVGAGKGVFGKRRWEDEVLGKIGTVGESGSGQKYQEKGSPARIEAIGPHQYLLG